MSFSYSSCDGTNDTIDLVRALIADTVAQGHIWEDSEILGFYRIQGLQFQSSQFFNAPAGSNLPSTPVSILRVAALMLDATANNQAKLAAISQLLDVHLAPAVAAKALHDQAAALREVDDNSGAFAIIEQVHTAWDFRQRFWNEVARQSA